MAPQRVHYCTDCTIMAAQFSSGDGDNLIIIFLSLANLIESLLRNEIEGMIEQHHVPLTIEWGHSS